jgi:hypothetical protein
MGRWPLGAGNERSFASLTTESLLSGHGFCRGAERHQSTRLSPLKETRSYSLLSSRDGVALALTNACESLERKQCAVYSKV